MKQEFRTKLLDVKKSDIVDVACTYLKQEKFGAFILGPELATEKIGKEQDELAKSIERVDLGF